MITSFDAAEISNWSDTADADRKLPELIRRLVLATLPEPPSRIDMPSGSSVRLPDWDGLLETEHGNTWAPNGVSGWEMSCDQRITSKANEDYKKRTAEPLGLKTDIATFVFVTSRRWRDKRRWERERRGEGKWCDVRAYDADDLVTWLEQSPKVTQWFAGEVRRISFDYEALNRIECLQMENRNETRVGFADMAGMRVELRTLVASIASQVQSLDSETVQNSEQQRLSDKMDAARELIQQGLIVAARTQLRRIESETEELPEALRFRLATNLAVCALGEDKFDEASSLLNEAHRIQPENPAGITNAALAAQIQQNPRIAADLARKALALSPRDSNAAANLIWALWEMGESEQLEGFVASEEWVKQESASASALAAIHAQQSRYEEAISIYRSLVDDDPDDAHAHLGLSQCLLTLAQVDRLPVEYSNEALKTLRQAESEADRAVELLQPTQFNARRHEALLLRSGARALLGEIDEAMRDIDAVMGEVPGHAVAALHKGLILLKKGRPSEALQFLESIQDPEVRANAVLPLADAFLESGNATAAITLLKGSFKLDPPGREDLGKAESLLRAEAATGAQDSVGPILEAALERYPDEAGLLILAATRGNLKGDAEASEAALIKAIELAVEPHHQAMQTQLGHLYESLGRFADAAEQFGKACGNNASHPAAVPMLLSLFNDRQFRKALELAQRIRDLNESPPRVVIEVEAKILEYVGDVGRAVLRHHELCSREDSTPDDRVRLAMAQFRCGERNAALATIRKIDVSKLRHEPQALMKLAHMKRFLGATDYLDDAYLSRRHGFKDPDIHLGYVSLLQGKDSGPEELSVVQPGCAVSVKTDDEEQWWQILEDGEDAKSTRDLSTDDDLAQRLLGRGVGDLVVLRQSLGGLSYKVTAIQSKYVRAYQETLEEFSTRFPDNISLSGIKLDKDFTQIFQSIELRTQSVRNSDELYQSEKLSFASFCSRIGRSMLEVWPEYMLQSSTRILFGSGTKQEEIDSSKLLEDADEIVLDMMALLTVHRLNLSQHLKERFSRVAIPQHAFDELQNTVYDMKTSKNPSGHIGKDSLGRYAVAEMPVAVWAEKQDYAQSVLELAESFERTASYRMLPANDADMFIRALTPAGAGAVYAGDEQSAVSLVLISDDLFQANAARLIGVGAVNTQALLVELLRSGFMTDQEYSSRIEQLVVMKYWFVRVRAVDILHCLEANEYRITVGSKMMLRTLRGPDCTEDAAASIGAELVASLVKGPLLQQQIDNVLSLVVAEMQRGRDTNQVLLKFKNGISLRLKLAPLQCAQILRTVNLYMNI